MKNKIKKIMAAVSSVILCALPIANGISASAAGTTQFKTYVLYNISQNPSVAYFDFSLSYNSNVTAEPSKATSLCNGGYFRSNNNIISRKVQCTYNGNAIGNIGILNSTKFITPMTTSSVYDVVKYTDAVIRDEYGITLSPTSITMDATLLGDVNLDGVVNNSDAELIMKALANPDRYKLNEKQIDAADVYERGTSGITNMDALIIQEYVQGQRNHF